MNPSTWLARAWAEAEPMQAPTQHAFLGFSAGLTLFALLLVNNDFVPVLDHANLAFHEAGHFLFGVFGSVPGLYGGTLMQFVFPALTTLRFAHRGQTLSAAACAAWFCENLRYMALYMGDARAQELPLVGGGDHDWHRIFSRWGVLDSDTAIAGFFAFLCWVGLAAIWVALWRLYRRGAA